MGLPKNAPFTRKAGDEKRNSSKSNWMSRAAFVLKIWCEGIGPNYRLYLSCDFQARIGQDFW
jgi:hypothetical protein